MILWLAIYSTVKRIILIGCLSFPNLTIRTAKMDRSRIIFGDFLFLTLLSKKEQFVCK